MVENSVQFKKTITKTIFYIVLIATCFLVTFPIYWLCNSSLQRESDLFSFPPRFWPQPISFEGYSKLFSEGAIWTWINNTTLVTVVTVFLTAIFATLAGYSFSRFKYRGRNALTLAIMSTQMIAGPMVITPLFIVFSKLKMIDTFSSLIIADTAMCMAVAVMLMKGFFDTIPFEIEEAAYIDGCNRLQTLWQVTLPISLNGFITVLVTTFFVTWNEYLFGLIFISDQGKWVGSVGLASFIGSYIVSQDQILAGATIFCLTPVLFFMIFQRFIVVGLTSGALKG